MASNITDWDVISAILFLFQPLIFIFVPFYYLLFVNGKFDFNLFFVYSFKSGTILRIILYIILFYCRVSLLFSKY